jgi:hypothetical protein
VLEAVCLKRKQEPDRRIYGHPHFCNTDFNLWLACLNLSGVSVGKDARASMRSAPVNPKKPLGFSEPFRLLGFSSGRFAVHVINNQSSQNQIGNFYLIV